MRLRQDGLIWRRAGREVIALDLARSEYLAINPTAAAVWEALADGATRENLIVLLCARFEVSPDVAAADLDSLLGQLSSEGLLEQRSGDA